MFRQTVGNVDKKWGGSYSDIMDSVNRKLLIYEDAADIYPGHGKQTTIGYEKANNPFLKIDSYSIISRK